MKRKKGLPATLACVADVHLGNHKQNGGQTVDGLNERCRLTLQTFRASIRAARERGAACYVVAGDLFHTRRPEPAVIAAVQRILAEEASDLPVVLVPGNHDMLDATAIGGNTAMAPLHQQATIVDSPSWIQPAGLEFGMLCVPFSAEMPMSDYLEQVLTTEAKKGVHDEGQVLVAHVGVYDDDSPPWCAEARDAIHADKLAKLMLKAGLSYAFVGNFHNGRAWEISTASIVQVGTLCPGGHGDAGAFPLVGGMALFDGRKHALIEVPGPRFVADQEDAVVEGLIDSVTGGPVNTFFVREPGLKAAPHERAELPQAQDAMGAIGDYVAAMKLPDGVQPPEVLEAARTYWSRG